MQTDYTIYSQFNNTLQQKHIVIGVDEVGRGCLFGHLTVCAVVLPADLAVFLLDDDRLPTHSLPYDWRDLTDSKKLSPKKREQLYDKISPISSYVIVDIASTLIDRLNIHQATLMGMKLAAESLINKSMCQHIDIVIDGNALPAIDHQSNSTIHSQTLIKGDSRHASIACASILAKVHRDRQMIQLDRLYPNYHIKQHKGYPTQAHKNAIIRYGILPEHRKSYAPIKALLAKHQNINCD